jgi:hypothetical protein
VDGGFGFHPSPAWTPLPLSDRQRLEAFLARLARMTPEQRIRASRYSFNSWERHVWAGHYPDEVPLVNGEVEWIALRSLE